MSAARARKRRTKPASVMTGTGSRVLVYGIGASGVSIARYFRRNRIDAIYFDTRTTPPGLDELNAVQPDAAIYLGTPMPGLLNHVSRVIVSPGVKDSDALLNQARDAGIDITSDVALFVAEADAPLIAVTGSNGKSTVTTLLSLMCDASGLRGLAGANLGTPALDLLEMDKPDIYILELSSFQLQRTPYLPAKVAVLLNISPDHLDWHADEEEYRQAKYRIYREARAAVINRASPDSLKQVARSLPCISFGLDRPEEGQYGIIEDGGQRFLARGDTLLLSTDDVAMVGAHNHANALAALAAGELMGLALSPMLQVLNEFPGLPHRMQRVRSIGGVDYINDSKATNVGAATAAVDSLHGVAVLIAGGDGKGGDFGGFAAAVYRKLRAVVLIGRDAPLLAAAFEGLVPVHMAGDMENAVHIASEIAEPGDTVLLAPACASFDQYQNYQRRGDDFRDRVEELAA